MHEAIQDRKREGEEIRMGMEIETRLSDQIVRHLALATAGISGATGLGTVTEGALEESNVNISAEFSDLIIA
jgi:flagellar hook protein FlgE